MHFQFDEWHCYLGPSRIDRSVKLYLSLPGPGQTARELQADGSMKEVGLYEESEAPPFATIPEDALQGILETLWARGLRPKDRRYEAEADLMRGQLAIQEKHLKDMRRLVFSPGKGA